MTSLTRLLAGLVLLVSSIAGALALSAGPAAACSCVGVSTDLLETSDMAFTGVVTHQRESDGDLIMTVRTDRVYRGDVTRRVDVIAGSQGDTCSIEVKDDAQLLVFGSVVDGEVTSSLCRTATSPDPAYRETVAELGAGTAPAAGYLKAQQRGPGLDYQQFSAGRAIFGVLGLTAMGYFAFRAWRARRRTT